MCRHRGGDGRAASGGHLALQELLVLCFFHFFTAHKHTHTKRTKRGPTSASMVRERGMSDMEVLPKRTVACSISSSKESTILH